MDALSDPPSLATVAALIGARILRGDPSAGPVNVVGEPIRSTETQFVVKP